MATSTTLLQPPSDGISSMLYSPSNPNLLLVGSWDSGVRLYDTALNSLRYYYTHKAPVLDVAFHDDDTHVLSGGLAQSLWIYDIVASSSTEVGKHDKPIKCVEYSRTHKLAYTGSWDKTVRAWDSRAEKSQVASVDCPERVYSMSLHEGANKLTVATAERHVLVFDLRDLSKGPIHTMESPLKFQTRCVRMFTTGAGFAISSIDGRVGMEYFAEADQKKKFAFRCHRKKGADGVTKVYPVNALAFNPVHGTFATGGCDGSVSTWDGVAKKRLAGISGFPTSVAALAFNCNGKDMAIASSYTFEHGDQAHPGDSIVVRHVADKEVFPFKKK